MQEARLKIDPVKPVLLNVTFYVSLSLSENRRTTRFFARRKKCCLNVFSDRLLSSVAGTHSYKVQEGLAVAIIARDDPSPLPGMHRDHSELPSQTDRQTDTDIVA